MKKILFIAAFAAVALAGCSKDSNEAGSTDESNAIDFRAVTNKQRASLIESTAELTNFYVKADKGDEDFSFMSGSVIFKEAGSWKYSPKKYYPTTAGTTVDFYAYAPVSDVCMTTPMAYNGSDVEFGYTVPADQSGHNTASDLVVSSVLGKSSGTVNFDFTHALSAVNFSAKNENVAADNLVYVVSKVEMIDMNNVGTYTFGATPLWASTTPVVYKAGVVSVAVGPTETKKLLSENNYMMMLPQTVAATAEVQVTFTVKDGDGDPIFEDEVASFPLTGKITEFEPGKRYNLTFKFAAQEAIDFDVTSVTGWVNSDNDINP